MTAAGWRVQQGGTQATADVAGQLERLARLRNLDQLTEDEYRTAKRQVLGRGDDAPSGPPAGGLAPTGRSAAAPPHAARTHRGPYRPAGLATLGMWVMVLMGVVAATAIGRIGLTATASAAGSAAAAADTVDRWFTLHDYGVAAQLAASVLLMVWLYRVHRQVDATRPGSFTFGAGWTVGGWFIPLANAYLPWRVARDIYRRAGCGGEPLVLTWWAGVVATVLLTAAVNSYFDLVDQPSVDGYLNLLAASSLAAAVSASAGAVWAWRLSSRFSS